MGLNIYINTALKIILLYYIQMNGTLYNDKKTESRFITSYSSFNRKKIIILCYQVNDIIYLLYAC